MIKMRRQDCLDKYPKFPLSLYDDVKDEIEHIYPEVFKSYILTLHSKTFMGNITLMGHELTRLMKLFGFDSLIFLGDTETPWLYQENKHSSVLQALHFLKDNKIGKKFNGAIQVDLFELPAFIKHLCWLSRCNASLPYFYSTDPGQNILGTICQYGNLHLDTLNEQTDNKYHSLLDDTKFNLLSDRICFERFSQSGAILGREIKL